MAVAVDDDVLCDLRRAIVWSVLDEEFTEQESLAAELRGARIVGEEIGELVAKDGGAAGFEDHDGCSGGKLRS